MALLFPELFLQSITPTTIAHQRSVADKVLSILSEADPNAIVAGGAPRDWYFGNTAKDIDVYFDNDCKDFSSADVEGLFLKHGIVISHAVSGEAIPEEYTGNPDLYYVIDCIVDGESVQLMGMTQPVKDCVVDKFPVSISQAWYKDGLIRTSLLFQIGEVYKMIFRCGEEYSSKVPYMQKIKGKFPDYRFVGF